MRETIKATVLPLEKVRDLRPLADGESATYVVTSFGSRATVEINGEEAIVSPDPNDTELAQFVQVALHSSAAFEVHSESTSN